MLTRRSSWLSGPTGLPQLGYVPMTNPLNGRCATVSGGGADFIKTSTASGMLGRDDASKFQSVVFSVLEASSF